MGVLAPGYAIGNTVHSLAVFATVAIDRMADLAVVFLQELLALPNQISRLILGPDGSQRPQKRTAEKECLPFHVSRRLPHDLRPATVAEHSEKTLSMDCLLRCCMTTRWRNGTPFVNRCRGRVA